MKNSSLKIFLLLGILLIPFGKLLAQTNSVGLPTGIYQEKEGSHYMVIDKFDDTLHLDPNAICIILDFSGVYLDVHKYSSGVSVRLRLDKSGKEKFTNASRKNLNKKFAFIFDGKLLMAPVISNILKVNEIDFSEPLPISEAKLLKGKLEAEIGGVGTTKIGGKEVGNSRIELLSACYALDSALVAKDTDKLAELFSNALTFRFSFGWDLEKYSFPYAFQLGYIDFTKIKQDGNATIKMDGRVASVGRILEVNGVYMGEAPFDNRIRVLEIWVKNNDRWQLFSRTARKME